LFLLHSFSTIKGIDIQFVFELLAVKAKLRVLLTSYIAAVDAMIEASF